MRPSVAFLLALFVAWPAADDLGKIVGTWKLVSFVNDFQDGSDPRGAYGSHPTSYIVFTRDGRMMSIVEATVTWQRVR